jgi:DNA invertase Pin-like site-specific DNA recombinase
VRVIGYVRVSTGEQAANGAGLAAQRDGITQEAARRGWEVVAVYEDGGASGRSLDGRPGLSAALGAVAGREADGLVVLKLDRLSRSLIDFAGLLERARRERWTLVALDMDIDTGSPQGEMLAHILATFAQFERRLIGERTRVALAARRREGVRLGRPPSVPPEIRARVAAERAAGRTLRRIAAGLDADAIPTGHGGSRWRPETVRRLVQQERAAAEASPGP